MTPEGESIPTNYHNHNPAGWAERQRIVNALRELAGLPPVAFDEWGVATDWTEEMRAKYDDRE